MESRERLRRIARIFVRAAALLHLAIQLFIFLPVHWRRVDPHRDTLYVYTAAERVRTGEPLYWPWPEYGPHVHTERGPLYPPERHPYPPFLATLLAPLTEVPFTTFARYWYIPLLAAFWVYAWSLARLVRGRAGIWDVLVAGTIVTLFPGAYRAVSLGQIDPVLWALFGVALVVPALRGASFAASAAVKLYAGWPLLFAAQREGRRVLVPALAVGAVLFVMSGLALGFDVYLDWARYMLPVIGQASFNPDNVSISFAGLRIARALGWEYVPGPLPDAARLYLFVVGIGAPLATGLALRRARPVLQYAFVGAAAVLFAPLCWSSYLPLLLVPLAVLLHGALGRFGDRVGEARNAVITAPRVHADESSMYGAAPDRDTMKDDEWRVAAQSRLQENREGESVDYPGRLATCPRGHVRALPSRFNRREFRLMCTVCGRDYLFREPESR